jgi:Domain of unknown function (DUF4384)
MALLKHAVLLASVSAVLPAWGQETPTSVRKTIDITIEQRQGSTWKPVSAQKVFRKDDVVRFRLRSQVSGYLYVLNNESDGVKTWLYPRSNASEPNYISVDKVYVIPDEKGSFTVGGRPGFDVTYWMISPNPLPIDSSSAGDASKRSALLPKCDGPLRARGGCEDKQAGPHTVTDPNDIPPAFSSSGALLSRELTFKTGTPEIQVSTPQPSSESIIYALWIAHQ